MKACQNHKWKLKRARVQQAGTEGGHRSATSEQVNFIIITFYIPWRIRTTQRLEDRSLKEDFLSIDQSSRKIEVFVEVEGRFVFYRKHATRSARSALRCEPDRLRYALQLF